MKEYMSVFETSGLESKDLVISGTNLNIFLYSVAAMHSCLTIPQNPILTYANCIGKKKLVTRQYLSYVLKKRKEKKRNLCLRNNAHTNTPW